MTKRLLGVGAGTSGGSAEILLKAALMEAEAAGAQVTWLRLDDVRIATTGPLFGNHDDDCRWFFEQVMAADGVIYSAPIYSRLLPGKLRLLADRVFGPHADVGLIHLLIEREAAGDPITVPFTPDERVLRPRVAAFIAVGGARTDRWGTLALPMMHSLAFSMRSGVVDQVRFSGAGTPRSIVLDRPALDRARLLGRNVAHQLGREYEDVEYRGEPGLCPLCHLDVIELRGHDVECASCGAQGRLELSADGEPAVVFDAGGLEKSVNHRVEKRAHSEEILDTAVRHGARADEVAAGAAPFADWGQALAPPGVAVAHD
jgi:multimeric flavodoxin WrbA